MTEVNKKSFAEILGVRPSYVTKLIKDGRLVMSEDGKRVLVEESKALIAATSGQRSDVAERHAEQRNTAPASQEAGHQKETVETNDIINLQQIKHRKAESEARRMVAIADQEEMARDKMAGLLVSREDVDFVMRDLGATFRGLMENLADRLTPVVFPLTTLDDVHAAITDVAYELQQEMAENMKRREQESGQ